MMKLEFQRKMDRIAGTFFCRLFSLFSVKRRGIAIDRKPKKVLVILLSEMGSLVLAFPMFKHIERKYPGVPIYTLLFEQNKEALQLLDVVPSENIFTVRNYSIWKLVKDSIHVLMKIRQKKIDAVVDCELFSRISSLYSFLSGAVIRAGFHPHTQEGLYRGDFINRPVLYNTYNHISQQFITLVEALESNDVPTVKREINKKNLRVPQIKINDEEKRKFKKRFEKDFPDIMSKKLILVYPGSGLLPIRAWPSQYYCQLVESFVKSEYSVGIIGIEKDKALADKILSHCKANSCINLTGYTKSIRELLIIFHFASLLVTNDGGPVHFAAMTPIPAINLYGPETPTLYRSLSPNSFSFYVQLSCSPCLTAYNHRNSPCDGNNLCLKYIFPEAVLKKAYEILES